MKLNGKKILILCGIPSTGQTIKLWIEEEGGSAYLAGSPNYALWFLKSEKFHGMIMQQDTANQQEMTVSEHVKKSREHKNTPIILLQDQSDAGAPEPGRFRQWSVVIREPLRKKIIIDALITHTLEARSTRSEHDIRITKCLVAGFRNLIRKHMNHEPSIGQIRLKPPEFSGGDALIFKQFSLGQKSGSLCWSLDTMFLTLLAKSFGEETLLEELDPWYIEEFLKKLDREIMLQCKSLFHSIDLDPDFKKPTCLISPGTQMNHINQQQIIQVPITHLGSVCLLEVSMRSAIASEPFEESKPSGSIADQTHSEETLISEDKKTPVDQPETNSQSEDGNLDEILEIE